MSYAKSMFLKLRDEKELQLKRLWGAKAAGNKDAAEHCQNNVDRLTKHIIFYTTVIKEYGSDKNEKNALGYYY